MVDPVARKVAVAAAVLLDAEGRFLLARRPPDTFYGGWWEFPGGKLELGETAAAALVRELREEMGIECEEYYPWLTREHRYPHAHVRLHFFRVLRWRGELRTLHHTAMAWQRAGATGVSPILPANGPVLAGLALPHIYAITNASALGPDEQLRRLDVALAQGLRLIQVREPDLSASELVEFARAVAGRAHPLGARVLLNGALDLARAAGADGIHLTARALMATRERPTDQDWLVAASCHDTTELAHAAALGADFAVLGHVCGTPSHPGERAMGWEAFAGLAAGLPIPVFAIGGLGMADMKTAWSAGAHGIAAIRAAWPA